MRIQIVGTRTYRIVVVDSFITFYDIHRIICDLFGFDLYEKHIFSYINGDLQHKVMNSPDKNKRQLREDL